MFGISYHQSRWNYNDEEDVKKWVKSHVSRLFPQNINVLFELYLNVNYCPDKISKKCMRYTLFQLWVHQTPVGFVSTRSAVYRPCAIRLEKFYLFLAIFRYHHKEALSFQSLETSSDYFSSHHLNQQSPIALCENLCRGKFGQNLPYKQALYVCM